MSKHEWNEWQARITPEQLARDKANNSAQASELLAYALAMGWLQQRTLEAEERIAASMQDGLQSLRIASGAAAS